MNTRPRFRGRNLDDLVERLGYATALVVLSTSLFLAGYFPDQRKHPYGESVAFLLDPIVVTMVASLPTAFNERVDFWVRQFTTAAHERKFVQESLDRAARYERMIRGRLRAHGLPEDLVYLSMIESGFSPTARSSAAAVGMWQFMAPTARDYGLRIDEYVDERRDPVAATEAAIRHLRDLYLRYDSWYLAAAAYNTGSGRLSRVLEAHAKNGGGDDDLYWQVINHLPRETRNYVPRLLAARLIARDAAAFGFESPSEVPYEFHRVWVSGGTSLDQVAMDAHVSEESIAYLNPHLIRGIVPPDQDVYPVRIPSGSAPDGIFQSDSRRRLADTED